MLKILKRYSVGLFFISMMLFGLTSFVTGDQKEFKTQFDKAYKYLSNDNYGEALKILKELQTSENPNPNILFMTGYCYLKSNSQSEQSIYVFESIKFPDDLNPFYSKGLSTETLAPVEAIFYLAEAYHFNYNFEKALETYNQYKNYISAENSEEFTLVKKRIEEVRHAIRFMQNVTDDKVFPMVQTNTTSAEYRPIPNGNGEKLYFTARRINETQQENERALDGEYYEDIYRSVFARGQWKYLEPVSELNTKYHEALLHLNTDETEILIYKFDIESKNGGDILKATKTDQKWSKPKNIGYNINSKAWETHTFITGGNKIVFTSDRKGTIGGRDIWIYDKTSDKITNLGKSINTKYEEEGAYLTDDGNTLYFSSKGHDSMGGFDIFVCTKKKNGEWSDPINMGMPINSPGDDVFFIPEKNGRDAYFSSFRKGGIGNQDLYTIPNKDRVNIYSGVATDENKNPINSLNISIYDIKTKEIIRQVRTDKNGEFSFSMLPSQSYHILTQLDVINEDTNGVNLTESNVKILETSDLKEDFSKILSQNSKGFTRLTKVSIQLSNELALAHNQILGELASENIRNSDSILNEGQLASKDAATDVNEDSYDLNNVSLNSNNTTISNSFGNKASIKTIYFDYNRTTMVDASLLDVKSLVAFMKENKSIEIILTGHTDSQGDMGVNNMLSIRRAKAVRNELIFNGINRNRMSVIGKGFNKPVADNNSVDGRQLNRRVEIFIVEN